MSSERQSSGGGLRVGCSGWSYDGWEGSWYPDELESRDRLRWYATQLNAVEINTTHYRTPGQATLDEWGRSVPAAFRFAVKLHRFGTHRKKLLDPEQWAPRAIEPARKLGDRCGSLLLQLPPRWRPELERLDHALATINHHRPRRMGSLAVEVRDPRWLSDELDDVLRRRRAVLCVHDLLPGLLDTRGESALRRAAEQPSAALYLRFHGPDRRHPYHGSYGARRLQPIAKLVAPVLRNGGRVDAYFNNDVDAAAPRDALRFATLLRSPDPN